jgi:hypothetical protein
MSGGGEKFVQAADILDLGRHAALPCPSSLLVHLHGP